MSFADLFNEIKQNAGDGVDTTFEEKGSIGGNGNKFKVEEDGVYDVVVDMVTFEQSKSSSSAWYEVTFKTEDGAKIKDRLFVLNKDGKPYNIDKNGQKKSTYGWNRMASLNYLINSQWDGLPVPEEKEIMIYDYDAKQDVAVLKPVVTSLINKPVVITVKMKLEDGYPDATVERCVPTIRNFLHPITYKTSTEERTGAEAVAIDNFKKSIADKPEPIDERDKSKGGNSTNTSKSTEPSGFNFSK